MKNFTKSANRGRNHHFPAAPRRRPPGLSMAEKKKMSVADILAAARAADGKGGSAPPQPVADEPAAAEAAPVEKPAAKPAAPKPAAAKPKPAKEAPGDE